MLEYEEGASYTTTTSNLVIKNQCGGGRYIEYDGSTIDEDHSFAAQAIYYSYIIFNCESPFV